MVILPLPDPVCVVLPSSIKNSETLRESRGRGKVRAKKEPVSSDAVAGWHDLRSIHCLACDVGWASVQPAGAWSEIHAIWPHMLHLVFLEQNMIEAVIRKQRQRMCESYACRENGMTEEDRMRSSGTQYVNAEMGSSVMLPPHSKMQHTWL